MASSNRFRTVEDIATYILREIALVAESAAGVDHNEEQPAIDADDKRLKRVKKDLRTALEKYRKYCYNLAAGQRLALSHNLAYWDSEREDAADWVLRTVKAVAELAAAVHKGPVGRSAATEDEVEEMKQDVRDHVEHYHGACVELGQLMVAGANGEEGSVETPFLDEGV